MRRNAGDEELRQLERAWRQSPDDEQLERQYLAAWQRVGFPGRDPRRDPVPGDIVQAFVGTSWRSRFDGEVRRFDVQGVVQEPSNDCSCFGRHYGQHDVDDCRGLRPRTRVYRRLLGTVGWSGQLFPPEEGQAIESDLLLRSWRAWAAGGEVVRRMLDDPRGSSPRRRNSDEGLRDLERSSARRST